MSELENLIARLQKSVQRQSPYIKTIRDPRLLIKSLKQLHQMIGNHKIKESVATQVSYLILNKHRQMMGQGAKDDVMLHCILTGDAGTGKSSCGVILAKIFYSLGYLSGPPKKKQTLFQHLPEPFKNSETGEESGFLNIFLILILLWILGLSYNFYLSHGPILTLVLIITLFVVVAAIFYYANQQMNDQKPIKANVTQQNTNNEECDEIDENDLVRVVSRVDMIGAYVGSSSIKTKELLMNNLGRLLIVDEAYNLMNSENEGFSMEALTTLNLFMSEHPGEIIIMFIGYKDKFDLLFEAQPGLKRRFMWWWTVDGYTTNELFDIFKLKLDQKNWKLDDYQETRKLFDRYDDAFPNYGGDIEKLLFFSCLEHSTDFIKGDHNIDVNTLYLPHVERGILKLKENSYQSSASKQSEYENPYSSLLNMFKRKQTNNRSYTFSEPVVEDMSLDDKMKGLVKTA